MGDGGFNSLDGCDGHVDEGVLICKSGNGDFEGCLSSPRDGSDDAVPLKAEGGGSGDVSDAPSAV